MPCETGAKSFKHDTSLAMRGDKFPTNSLKLGMDLGRQLQTFLVKSMWKLFMILTCKLQNSGACYIQLKKYSPQQNDLQQGGLIKN